MFGCITLDIIRAHCRQGCLLLGGAAKLAPTRGAHYSVTALLARPRALTRVNATDPMPLLELPGRTGRFACIPGR